MSSNGGGWQGAFPARADIDLWEEFPRIALAPNGETYVSGTWIDDTGDRDYVTIKYGGAGDRAWVARYDEPLVSGVEGLLVRTDSQGHAYLVANSLGPGGVWNTDYLVVKYDVNGVPLWTARYDDQIGSRDAASAFTFDAEGNTYVTGGSAGLGTESDYTTAKYDPNGQQAQPQVPQHVVP